MDIQAELKHMSDEIFHEELSKKMLDASLQEMEEDDFLIPEDEYNEGVAELTKIFRDDQRAKFDQMEELCKQNIMYLIKFAFGRGLYTALEQYFVEQSQEEPFRKLVEEQILQYPEMTQYSEYFDRREQIHGLYRQLKAELNDEMKEHLISVDVGWENREYGVLRHSFYLGYRAGLALLESVTPEGENIQQDMDDKALRTEKELCINRGHEGLPVTDK